MKKTLKSTAILLIITLLFTCNVTGVFAAQTVKSIAIVKQPTKLAYVIGEPFTDKGLVVQATYSDGTTGVVENSKLTFNAGPNISNGYAFQMAGTKNVSISYGGCKTKFVLTVGTAPVKPAKIVFNANGGKGKMASLKVTDMKSSKELPTNKFTRKGYKFIGWSTSKKIRERDDFVEPDTALRWVVEEGKTVTLYAQWVKPAKYKITYNLGKYGSFIGKAPRSYTSGTSLYLPSPESKKANRSFSGWYTSSKFKESTRIDSIEPYQTGNLKLYAYFVDTSDWG